MEQKTIKPDTAHLPLRERNKRRTIQRILDAAFALFEHVGYEQTTIDMIAENAEVSRATLFNYFPSKQSMLLPFANALYIHHVEPQIHSYIETQPTLLAALRYTFLSIHKHILTYPDIEEALRWGFFHPHALDNPPSDGTRFLETLQTIIQQHQQRGELHLELPAETLARYVGALYVSLLYGVLQQPSLTNYEIEVERLLTFLQAAFRLDDS